MTLSLNHFDTKTRQDFQIKEEIKYCLASYLFPDAKFSIGHIEPESVKAPDLKPYQGQSLQFSSGKRMYFSDQEVGAQLFPTPSDRAAYGSLPFTPLKSLHELKQAKILVIDDQTGNSGGVMANQEFAKTLVGDCYGKMSPELAAQFTEKTNTPIQFRLGIRPQEGNDVTRIAKGTLAPDPRLNRLGGSIEVKAITNQAKQLNFGRYDLILATSMFKGRKGEDAIQPGSYQLDLGLGVKTQAEYGKQKLGIQVLVNYPKGVEKDILPNLKKKVRDLKDSCSESYKMAQEYIEYYEDRHNFNQSLDDNNNYLSPREILIKLASPCHERG